LLDALSMIRLLTRVHDQALKTVDRPRFAFLAALLGCQICEWNSGQKMVENTRVHLVLLGEAYLNSAAKVGQNCHSEYATALSALHFSFLV